MFCHEGAKAQSFFIKAFLIARKDAESQSIFF
jgi:hypothetical protein